LPEMPFSESYWVIPGVFLAGEHPSRNDDSFIQKRIQSLVKMGISVFYDLTQKNEGLIRYDKILFHEAEEVKRVAEYKNFPIQDFTAPSARIVKSILDAIDQDISSGKQIYVHCGAGIGRTGTVVGSYLVRHGLSGQAALERIAELRQGLASRFIRSPEAQSQVDLVLHWKNGQ
jgi:protein-tyrosine phosphatase